MKASIFKERTGTYYIVSPEKSISRERFDQLMDACRAKGGKYWRAAKDGTQKGGFAFGFENDARAFMADHFDGEVEAMSFDFLIQHAHRQGMEAGKNAITDTMVVTNGKQDWIVPDGPCGFAWITIRPARGAFVSFCKKNRIGSLAYGGGWQIWVGEFGQSMQRKEAYAREFANVLQEHGINAYASSRMD